jgi:hypothetical protein
MWAAGNGSRTLNIGKILDGELDNDYFKNDDQLDWFKTTIPTNRWIASDTALVRVSIRDLSGGRSELITPTTK